MVLAESFGRWRCLVLADGFCGERTVNKKKMPVWFHLKDNAPFLASQVSGTWPARSEGVHGHHPDDRAE